MVGARERSISVPPPSFSCLTWVQLFVQLYIFYKIRHTKKKTNKQTNKVLQATSHVCRLRSGCEPTFFWPTTVTAKPKTSRQKQKHHGETKNLTAKTKYVTAKPKTSRQNQILHSKNKIALVLPWVFAFAVRYLVFAVKYLFLP